MGMPKMRPWLVNAFGMAIVFAAFSAHAAPLSYYLPAGETYDSKIPTPEAALGYDLGSRVVRPDLINAYAKMLDEASDRVTSEVIGYTHERRPIIALVITSPENHAKLEAIRTKHLTLSSPSANATVDDSMPVVTWLGFGVHGDEVSSLDAAMLTMYQLAASTGEKADRQRQSSIVVMIPSLNPDGFGRASEWMNLNSSLVPVTDDQNREHNPGWPRGRGNHYWFDLNRQWLVQSQPEPQAWLRLFQHWKPNISADFHEMPSDSTFFFSPGTPDQVNPHISKPTRDLQKKIAGRFAETLNQDRDFYFSEEFFDEFNPAMGSNFPAINGAVGYLFENRGFTGRTVENDTGIVTLESRIRRHFHLAMATAAAAVENKRALLDHQKKFYDESLAFARAQRTQAYLFAAPNDATKSFKFLELLKRHEVRAYKTTREIRVGENVFAPGESYVVPLAQPQYRVIQNIFETPTKFDDVVFYDLSTWTMALAYGLDVAPLTSNPTEVMSSAVEPKFPSVAAPATSEYAYAFSWDSLYAPRAVNRILNAGGRARVATQGFTGVTSAGRVAFRPGTIVVPVGEYQGLAPEALHTLLSQIAKDDGIVIHALPTGSTPTGIDLGSNAIVPLRAPKPLIVTGDAIRQYDAGELWYLLDQTAEIATTLRDMNGLRSADLTRYTHIIMPDGVYASLGEDTARAIDSWVKAGGTLIATKRGALWAIKNNFIATEIIDDRVDSGFDVPPPKDNKSGEKQPPPPVRLSYAQKDSTEASVKIRGAIFAGQVDMSHPIGFGYQSKDVPLFRETRVILGRPKNPYATVAAYGNGPQLAGFVSEENLKKMPGSAAVIAERRGKGSVILFADNPAFRAYWHANSKLVLNAMFFSTAFMAEGQRFGAEADED